MTRSKDPRTAAAAPTQVALRGPVPFGAASHAEAKLEAVLAKAHDPVLFVRITLTQGRDPAVARPAVAQVALDLDGRPVQAQAAAPTMFEAVDLLTDRLQRRLSHLSEHWAARRAGTRVPWPAEWQHGSELSHRPDGRPLPAEDREIVTRRSFTPPAETPDDAALEMEALDYDFHLFTDTETGLDSVVYRAGPTGYRVASTGVRPDPEPGAVPLTVSHVPAQLLTPDQATERLDALDLPFVFFIDADSKRGNLVYHRYDGHYGRITPTAAER